MAAEPKAGVAEDAVADPEPGDRRTGRLHLTRELGAEDPPPRPADARDKPADAADDQAVAAVGFPGVTVEAIDGGGMDSDQELMVPGSWPLHLLDAEDVGRPVAVVDDGFHIGTESGMVRTRRYRGRPVARLSPALGAARPAKVNRPPSRGGFTTTCDRSPARRAAVLGDVRAAIGYGRGSRNGCPSCLQELAGRMVNGRAFVLGCQRRSGLAGSTGTRWVPSPGRAQRPVGEAQSW